MLVLRFILANLDRYRARFWASVSAGLIASLANLSIPLFLAEFTKTGLSYNNLGQLILWLIVAIIVSLACSWVIRRHGEALAYQFPNYLRLKYFGQLEQLPMNRLAQHHSGYILSLVNQIGDRLENIFFDFFWTFTGIVANIGFLVYFTATRSFGLTMINLGLFLVFVIVSTILARRMTRLADDMNKASAFYGQYFIDFMSNLVTIKRLGVRSFAEDRLGARSEDSNRQIQHFYNAHSNRWLLLHTIYYTANFVTIGFLLYEIAKGKLPVGLLILFIALYSNIRSIIERLAENIITFTETGVYIRNLTAILDIDKKTPSAKKQAEWRQIELKDVEYQHNDNQVVVRIPQLAVKKGDRVCIYGTSGEGKTTVLNLLANYLEPNQGNRTLDGTSYNELDPTWLVRESAFISQEVELFNLSLWDNLSLGQKVSSERVWQLLTDLELADWVRGLEEGLETVVGEKGLRLSAGQKQRVNLARGILLDRSLYLLDEPTSHLDDDTEKAVIKVIERYLKGKTVVIVTHRPAIKRVCNKFYEMKNHLVSEVVG